MAIGQKVLASQPFSVLIGAQLIKLEAGAVEIHIPVKEELKQQYGFMHGGVIQLCGGQCDHVRRWIAARRNGRHGGVQNKLPEAVRGHTVGGSRVSHSPGPQRGVSV